MAKKFYMYVLDERLNLIRHEELECSTLHFGVDVIGKVCNLTTFGNVENVSDETVPVYAFSSHRACISFSKGRKTYYIKKDEYGAGLVVTKKRPIFWKSPIEDQSLATAIEQIKRQTNGFR